MTKEVNHRLWSPATTLFLRIQLHAKMIQKELVSRFLSYLHAIYLSQLTIPRANARHMAQSSS